MRRFKHLSIEERYEIKSMRDKGATYRLIATHLQRSHSGIYAEIKRNKGKSMYMPCVAQRKYEARLHKEDGLRIEKNPALLEYIVDKLQKCCWSPDAIAGRLRMENSEYKISSESIYKFIYTSPIARRFKLHQYLATRRLARQVRGKRITRVIIPCRVSIHKREKVATQKVEIGHFEGDLTFHKGNQSSNIGCMVDKLSQKVFLVKNRSKSTQSVTAGFVKKMKELPKKFRRTFTMDNGKEFVGHTYYKLLGFNTYFCDAYRPRQKALVEKMNCMLHKILPKSIDITTITQAMLDKAADTLNNLPRKILGYKTPNEVWAQFV